jgi:hypothetical protein
LLPITTSNAVASVLKPVKKFTDRKGHSAAVYGAQLRAESAIGEPQHRGRILMARQGIDAIAAELGVASVAADEIYQPAQ